MRWLRCSALVVVSLLAIACDTAMTDDPFDSTVEGYRQVADSLSEVGATFRDCRTTGVDCGPEAIAVVDALAAADLPPRPNSAPDRVTALDNIMNQFSFVYETARRNVDRFDVCGASTCQNQVVEVAANAVSWAGCVWESSDEQQPDDCRS